MKSFVITGVSRGLGAAYIDCLFNQAKAIESMIVIGISRSSVKDSEWYTGQEKSWTKTDASIASNVEVYQYQNNSQYKMIHVQGSVSDESLVAQLLQIIQTQCNGQLTGLLCNAATIHPIGRIADLDMAGLVSLFQTNFFSTIRLTQAMIPALRKAKNATVILLGSGIVHHPAVGTTSYTCSKTALDMFSRILSMEEGPYGTRSLCIYPGIVKTKMLNDMLTQGEACLEEDHFKWLSERSQEGLHPSQPAKVITHWLLNGAPESYNGFIGYWDDAKLALPSQ